MLSENIRWRRLYTAVTLAGAALGLLLALEALPAVPQQLTTWIRGASNKAVPLVALVAGGALIGLALTAVGHVGIRWQLRRSKAGAGR